MVVVWGNILSFIGNVFAVVIGKLIFDAFFPRNEKRNKNWIYTLLLWTIYTSFSILIGTKLGYTFKMLQEISLLYVFSAFLYQSRWDRRLFIVVTVYAVLFSYSYWFESIFLYFGNWEYEEYIWNIPLYSAVFFVRGFISLCIALLIRKYHHPLHTRTHTSAWVPLSAVFPVCTLLVLGNVIDNAMEACADLSEQDRWVSIQILYSKNMLSLLIVNPSENVQISNGHIPTTKQDSLLHGFGISNVKDILEKYHAEYLFTYEDGRFIFSADWPDRVES